MRVWHKVLLLVLAGGYAHAAAADTYVVPVGERNDLLSVNKIAMEKAQFKQLSDGAVSLKYKLPALLVGKAQENLHFIGIPKVVGGVSSYDLQGPQGSGVCTATSGGQFDCLLHYNKDTLKIDAAGVQQAIDRISRTDLERQLRRDVAEIFSNDPIGIAQGIKLKRRSKVRR